MALIWSAWDILYKTEPFLVINHMPERLNESLTGFMEVQTATSWGRTLKSFASWCNPLPNERVLDVGCGPGLLPALFHEQGCQATGVELDLSMFRPRPLHHQVACADAERLPFAEESFDLITCSNLLFYLPSPDVVLVEMRRMLKHRGRIGILNPSPLLSVQTATQIIGERKLDGPARTSLLDWAQRAESHRRWSIEEFQHLCQGAGLAVKAWTYRVGPGFAIFTLTYKNEP